MTRDQWLAAVAEVHYQWAKDIDGEPTPEQERQYTVRLRRAGLIV